MKFSEKLQKLRKEHKLSQEQLADQLDISRQAVSKWESGQTYPEMDKLIAICKLFKCSLDELTNDEIKEINKVEKEKVTVNKLIDEVLDTITRSRKIIQKLSFFQIIKYTLELIFLILILILFQFPVEYIYQLGANIFNCLAPSPAAILCSIWKFILSISYLIFAIICFYYLYKILFLEKWEQSKEIITEKKKANIEKEGSTVEVKFENLENKRENEIKISTEKKKEEVHIRKNHPSVILKILNSIVSFFAKLCLALTLLPFLLFFFFLIVVLILSVYLMFHGITYFGVFLLLLGGLIFSYLVIEIIFNIIVNRRNSVKKIGVLFLISLIILGTGSGVSLIELTGFTYDDSSLPYSELYEIEYFEKEVEIEENLILSAIGTYNEMEYIEDSTRKDTVKIKVEAYGHFSKVRFDYEQDALYDEHYLWIRSESKLHPLNPEMRQLILDSLREKTLYNFQQFEQVNIKIYTSKENIEQLKKYKELSRKKESRRDLESEREKYDTLMEDYQNQISEYQDIVLEREEQIYQLENKIQELEIELEDTKRKIQEYKEQISSIITE